MVLGGEQLQADKLAAQALERLKRDGLAPLPENYAIFFHYFAGTNASLKMAMDVLLSQNNALNQQQCTELYQAHLGVEAEHRALKETNTAIEAEIAKVMGVIDTASAGTTKFGQTLDTISGKLTPTAPIEQIREAVAKVASESRAMAKQNEKLQSQLAETTHQLTEMRTNLDAVHRESQIDPLTEVGNRKFFTTELNRTMREAAEAGTPLTLLVADIDHFKKFNDSYGHLIGDQVLRLVARTLVENLKGRDVIARYGGEEFVILLPQTKVADAERVANLLRASLATKQIRRRSTNETLGTVTVSVGAAEYCPGEDAENLIARADAGLYKAKDAGRNRVVIEPLTAEQAAALRAKVGS